MFLNGWRRLGICLVVLWVSALSAMATYQYFSHAKGSLVCWSLPRGTVVGDGEATLPNGKVVSIDDVDSATGRKLEPWQIDWDHQANMPREAVIFWGRLAVLALVIPGSFWIVLEMLAMTVAWIGAGFRSRAP